MTLWLWIYRQVLLLLIILYIVHSFTHIIIITSLLAVLQLIMAENWQHWFKVISLKKKNTVFWNNASM